jgi:hypothetical protein
MFSSMAENALPVNTMASADKNRKCQEGGHRYYEDTVADLL